MTVQTRAIDYNSLNGIVRNPYENIMPQAITPVAPVSKGNSDSLMGQNTLSSPPAPIACGARFDAKA